MRPFPHLLTAVVLASLLSLRAQPPAQPAPASAVPRLECRTLAPLPDREGFAGSFAGVSGGALLVAGGANFPARKPWEGGPKVWHDTVFVLEQPAGAWRRAGRLPRPLGYGVSVTTPDGVLCLGGSDARRHYRDTFLLTWSDGRLHRRKCPPLPRPCANLCGALVGNVVYLAGGNDSPLATNALRTFWALDLSARRPRWQELEPWPGPARMLAVAAARNGAFYLFSGVSLQGGPDGKPVRTYLRDAFRYEPGGGWRHLPDLPHAAVAAPSPALGVRGHLLVATGDDGTRTRFPAAGPAPRLRTRGACLRSAQGAMVRGWRRAVCLRHRAGRGMARTLRHPRRRSPARRALATSLARAVGTVTQRPVFAHCSVIGHWSFPAGPWSFLPGGCGCRQAVTPDAPSCYLMKQNAPKNAWNRRAHGPNLRA